MNTEQKLGTFVKQVVAILKGDDAEATGQKILRQADSALKTQIASLTGDTISLEDAVENAQENIVNARVNGAEQIKDRNLYVSNLLKAKNALTDAEENLASHKEKLAFLESELVAISK